MYGQTEERGRGGRDIVSGHKHCDNQISQPRWHVRPSLANQRAGEELSDQSEARVVTTPAHV